MKMLKSAIPDFMFNNFFFFFFLVELVYNTSQYHMCVWFIRVGLIEVKGMFCVLVDFDIFMSVMLIHVSFYCYVDVKCF